MLVNAKWLRVTEGPAILLEASLLWTDRIFRRTHQAATERCDRKTDLSVHYCFLLPLLPQNSSERSHGENHKRDQFGKSVLGDVS
jgi:hypothetical protein